MACFHVKKTVYFTFCAGGLCTICRNSGCGQCKKAEKLFAISYFASS